MKVKMIRNAPRPLGCELKEGESGNVDDSLAQELVRLGVAKLLPIETTPPKPTIAEAKAPTITKTTKADTPQVKITKPKKEESSEDE